MDNSRKCTECKAPLAPGENVCPQSGYRCSRIRTSIFWALLCLLSAVGVLAVMFTCNGVDKADFASSANWFLLGLVLAMAAILFGNLAFRPRKRPK